MNEEFQSYQQPIYHNLWIYWLMQLIALVLMPFDHIIASLVGLAVGVVQLYELYAMRDVSDGMGRAWRTMLLSLALTFGGLLMTLLALGSVLSILLLLVALAGLIVMIVADYYFYFALDGLISLAVITIRRGVFDGVTHTAELAPQLVPLPGAGLVVLLPISHAVIPF